MNQPHPQPLSDEDLEALTNYVHHDFAAIDLMQSELPKTESETNNNERVRK